MSSSSSSSSSGREAILNELRGKYGSTCSLDWDTNVHVVFGVKEDSKTHALLGLPRREDVSPLSSCLMVIVAEGEGTILGFLSYYAWCYTFNHGTKMITRYHLQSQCHGAMPLMHPTPPERMFKSLLARCWEFPLFTFVSEEEDVLYEEFMQAAIEVLRNDYYCSSSYNVRAHELLALVWVDDNDVKVASFHAFRMRYEMERVRHLTQKTIQSEWDVVHLLAHNRALPTQVLNPSPVFLQWYYDTHVKGREEEEEEKQEAPSLMFRVDPLDLVPGVEYVSWRDLMPHWILNQMAMNNMQLAWRRTRKNKVNDYLRDWSRDLITKLWDVFCEQQRKLQQLQHHSSGPKFPLLTGKGVRFSIEHMVERLFPPCIRAAHNKQRFLRYNERLVVVAYMCNAGFTEDEIVYYFTHLNTLYPKKPNPMKLEVRFSMKSYLNEQRKKPNPQYCKNIWKNSTDPKRAQDPDRVRCPFVVSDIEDSLQAQEQCKNKCCDKMKFSGPHDLTLRWMQ